MYSFRVHKNIKEALTALIIVSNQVAKSIKKYIHVSKKL